MTRSIREYTACWIRHEPNLEVGTIQLEPSEFSDISDEIARAKKFDPEASISLIERFCTAANNNSDLDDRLLRYIAEALRVLVQNGETDLFGFAQTLGIQHPNHRPTMNEIRDREIFFEVREQARTTSLEKAFAIVGRARYLSEDTVKNIYKAKKRKHIEFLKEMDEYSDEVTTSDWAAIRMLIENEKSDE